MGSEFFIWLENTHKRLVIGGPLHGKYSLFTIRYNMYLDKYLKLNE